MASRTQEAIALLMRGLAESRLQEALVLLKRMLVSVLRTAMSGHKGRMLFGIRSIRTDVFITASRTQEALALLVRGLAMSRLQEALVLLKRKLTSVLRTAMAAHKD